MLSGLLVSAQQTPEYAMSRSEWPLVLNGKDMVQIPALKNVLRDFETDSTNLQIEIRYPGGDAGNAWALVVQAWLVALGVASSDIVLEPGSGDPQNLKFQAIRRL